jgi:GNAT superfamily N-acetyltransferase
MSPVEIRPLHAADRAWVADFLREQWGSSLIVSRGKLYEGETLPGFAAFEAGRPIGLALYHLEGAACELVSLDSLVEGRGTGAALIEAVKEVARQAGCRRLWLITTNDNTHALRFYQKRGFVLAALHRNAIEHSRRLKPQIPLVGLDGIPIRDEIELEMMLDE